MSGTGPGIITADGCAVELYRRLPVLGEADVVHDAIAPAADVLDLGCGTGRIAHRLIELGHPVVAVDESAEMLAYVRGAETVCTSIEDLDLGRTFGAVLMASHLVNVPESSDRQALLGAARAHLRTDGVLIAQWHPPDWFDRVAEGQGGRLGDIRSELTDVRLDDGLLSATVRYQSGGEVWTQSFTARRLDEPALHRSLNDAELAFDRWLTEDRTWFAAKPG